MMKQSTQKCS